MATLNVAIHIYGFPRGSDTYSRVKRYAELIGNYKK